MAKVSNVMATKISLDMVEASTSVKNLTTVVNSATQAWKANEANMRSAGDYAGAAKAKYDGLGNAIEAQRNKIEALERKQSEMNNIDKETADKYITLKSKLADYRKEMDELDTTTEKGKTRYKELDDAIKTTQQQLNGLGVGTVKTAEQFLKYGQQVDRAKAKLASLQSQQQRAAQQVDLENSGIIRLNATMRAQSALAAATAERMRSEGQNYQAMGVEVNSLRSRLDSLRTIQSREMQLLDTTRTRMGETSSEYLKQATRVEELGTEIQETRSKLSELNETMRRTPTGWMGNVASRLDSIQGKADRVSTTFGRIFGATAAANLFTNALSSMSARMGDLIKAGVDYNIEQNKMQATWTTLTGSAAKAGPMIDSINSMAQATGQNVDVVNELEQGFYHLNSSKSQADGMTSSLLNMADAVGLTSEQIKAVEQDMVHGMATGKITQGELNQIGQYFPMIDEAMAKHFNTTVAGMRQMAKAGKISAKDLQDVFEQLGNGKYKAAAENMMNSYYGVFRTIQARTPKLVSDITKPFMNISNPFLQSVRKWINDKSTDDEFNRLGKQMAQSMNQIIKAFGGNNVSVTKIMDNAIRSLTDGVRQFGKVVADHHKEISNFFSAFKTGSTAQAKLFVNVLSDLSKVLLPVLNLMARFPKTSAALVTSFVLASRAVRTLQAGIRGFETLKVASTAIQGFINRIRKVPDKKSTKFEANTVDADHRIGTTNNKIKALPGSKKTDLVVRNGAANTSISNTRQNVEQIPSSKVINVAANTSNASRGITNVRTEINGTPRTVQIIAKANTTQANANLTRLGRNAVSSGNTAMRGMTLVARGAGIARAGLAVLGGPAGVLNLAIMGFQALYQHNAKFRKFANGVANSAKSMANKVGRWFGNMASSAGRHISRMAQSAKRGWNNINRTSQRSSQREVQHHSQMAQRNQRSAQQMWSRLSRAWIQGWNRNGRLTRQGVQQQIQQHRTMSTRVAVFNTQLWNRSRQLFSKGWSDLRNSTRNGTNNVNNEFNRMRVSVGQRAQQAMNDAKNHFKRGYSDIKSNTSDWRGDISNLWSDTRSKIGGIADGLRSDSTNKFSDMHSKLNDLTNNGLGQMHDAWHDKLEGIASVVTSSGGHIHQQFVGLLRGLAKPFETLINGVKDGVNWILDKVGGDGKLGGWTFNAFANGTNGPIEKDQLALLNDAPGSHYQEMVHRADTGETFMLPAKRNMVFPLKRGDEVLDGERSHQLASMMQLPIPHADGAIGDFFSGLWNGAKELEDVADDALKNIVGFGKSLFSHFISGVSIKSSDKLNGGLKLNLPSFYANRLQNWLKKQLDDLGSKTPKNGNWAPVVKKALRKNGLPDSDAYVNAWLRQIQTESGGNPRAVQGNIGDANNATGDLAKGLVQTISATFNAYKFPGHGNIFNGYDNLLAGIAYAKAKYGAGGMLSVIGHGHGYANGGIATQPSIFGEAGAEMAIPLDTMKSTRAWQLLRQVVNYYAGSDAASDSNSTSLTDLKPLEQKFDAVLAQNQALIGLVEKLIGVTDAVNNPTARYRRTQRDVNLAQAQSFIG